MQFSAYNPAPVEHLEKDGDGEQMGASHLETRKIGLLVGQTYRKSHFQFAGPLSYRERKGCMNAAPSLSRIDNGIYNKEGLSRDSPYCEIDRNTRHMSDEPSVILLEGDETKCFSSGIAKGSPIPFFQGQTSAEYPLA